MDSWHECNNDDCIDFNILDMEGVNMKWSMRELMVLKFTLGATCVFWQAYLIYKYEMQWWDWLVWGALCVAAVLFARILGMTEGIIETIQREKYYKELKQMLFNDDERNTPDRMRK